MQKFNPNENKLEKRCEERFTVKFWTRKEKEKAESFELKRNENFLAKSTSWQATWNQHVQNSFLEKRKRNLDIYLDVELKNMILTQQRKRTA